MGLELNMVGTEYSLTEYNSEQNVLIYTLQNLLGSYQGLGQNTGRSGLSNLLAISILGLQGSG